MRIGRTVDWEQDVFAAWRRTADNAARPNSDVWGRLPEHVCWVSAWVEEIDIPRLYVIGSSDWKEVFGTYRLSEIGAKVLTSEDDRHRHSSRIIGIGAAYATGREFEPVAMVSYSGEGPFVVIDGNHRAVALYRIGLLVGREVYLGLHPLIGTRFGWFRHAVEA